MRLFIAVELNEEVRNVLVSICKQLRPRVSDVRWTSPEQLHLTIKFLGEVEESRISELTNAIDSAAQNARPFDFRLDGAGCFPSHGPARIVWAGLHEATGRLFKLVSEVEAAMEAPGFPRESREFSPHVTIGRVKEDRSAGRIRSMVESQAVPPASQSVNRLTLMSSKLSPNGSIYSTIHQSPLAHKRGAE